MFTARYSHTSVPIDGASQPPPCRYVYKLCTYTSATARSISQAFPWHVTSWRCGSAFTEHAERRSPLVPLSTRRQPHPWNAGLQPSSHRRTALAAAAPRLGSLLGNEVDFVGLRKISTPAARRAQLCCARGAAARLHMPRALRTCAQRVKVIKVWAFRWPGMGHVLCALRQMLSDSSQVWPSWQLSSVSWLAWAFLVSLACQETAPWFATRLVICTIPHTEWVG